MLSNAYDPDGGVWIRAPRLTGIWPRGGPLGARASATGSPPAYRPSPGQAPPRYTGLPASWSSQLGARAGLGAQQRSCRRRGAVLAATEGRRRAGCSSAPYAAGTADLARSSGLTPSVAHSWPLRAPTIDFPKQGGMRTPPDSAADSDPRGATGRPTAVERWLQVRPPAEVRSNVTRALYVCRSTECPAVTRAQAFFSTLRRYATNSRPLNPRR